MLILSHGPELIQRCIVLAISNKIKTIEPIVVILGSLMPMFLLILTTPAILSPLWAIFTIPLFYVATKPIQSVLFTFGRAHAYLKVILPLEAFILLWAFLLLALDKAKIIFSVAGIFLLLIICSILPVLRLDLSRAEAKVPYSIVFWICGAIVMFIQIYNFLRYLK